MHRVRVKICGITDYQNASMAVEMGADALGFIFAASPRQVTPQKARQMIRSLPPFVQTVGVFVDEHPAAIKEIIRLCGLDMVQLHGDETPEMCRELMPHTIKAFRLKKESDLEAITSYCGTVKAFLFDTYEKGKPGGTGNTFDWTLAVKGKQLGAPIILAGGLNPSNIAEAISTVRPFAVDVNSGVEESPGKKDPALVKKLMDRIGRLDSGRDTQD